MNYNEARFKANANHDDGTVPWHNDPSGKPFKSNLDKPLREIAAFGCDRHVQGGAVCPHWCGQDKCGVVLAEPPTAGMAAVHATQPPLEGVEPVSDADNQWFGDMMILQVLADSDNVNEQEREVLTRWMAASDRPTNRAPGVAPSDRIAQIKGEVVELSAAIQTGDGAKVTDLGAAYFGVAPSPSDGSKRAMRSGFMFGWKAAAVWAHREDLIADIGSPAYERDCDAACGVKACPPGHCRTPSAPCRKQCIQTIQPRDTADVPVPCNGAPGVMASDESKGGADER